MSDDTEDFDTTVRTALAVIGYRAAAPDRCGVNHDGSGRSPTYELQIRQYLEANLTDVERDALCAIARTGGPDRALAWLDGHFAPDAEIHGDVPHGHFVPFRFVRIRPTSQRARYVMMRWSIVFDREVGWYEVSRPLAAACATEHENENDPTSPTLFEVACEIPVAPITRVKESWEKADASWRK